MSFFEKVPLLAPDPILGLTLAYQRDSRKNKVNLGVGLYKTHNLKTPVLRSVKRAEELLLSSQESKEYLPIDGDRLYLDHVGEMVFEREWYHNESRRIASFQTVGGTGALKIAGLFLKEQFESSLWISNFTWPNHKGVFLSCALKVQTYPYYDPKTQSYHLEAMVHTLETLPRGSVVLLHASCHNPTGCDPEDSDWEILANLFEKKGLIPFFDFAYQGLGDGLAEDAKAVRLFARKGLEMIVAVSNAKNLSLYAERLGALFIISQNAHQKEPISSSVKRIIRTDYSNPPIHGAKVAGTIFGTSDLKVEWEQELASMRERIKGMRHLLAHKLPFLSHMGKGKGMFGVSGLSKSQVTQVIDQFGIYMPHDGRINVCGLNEENIDYVAEALRAVYNVE